MKKLVIFAAIVVSFTGCDKKADKVQQLETEVLAIHDDVMPQMDDIMSLKSQLSKKIQSMDSLQNEGVSSNTTAEERIKAVDLNQRLNESDKLMMDWMHAYRGDSAKKLKPEAAILYFEKEKEKILQVKQQTVKAIEETKTFLE